MEIRTVFMGSPEFAVPAFEALVKNFNVVGVVTQPDRKSGRGRKLTPPPVKVFADENRIPVIQPIQLREPEAFAQLKKWNPDVIVVAAYGQILREDVLNLPQYGCVNVHASLLPRWRGASPVHHAILYGDAETGITIMKMDKGLDTGAILAKRSIIIKPNDTTAALSTRLAFLGADLLVEALPGYVSGIIEPVPQDNTSATYAPMLKKADGALDFTHSARELERRIRAFTPWPGTYFSFNKTTIKVHRASMVSDKIAIGRRLVVGGYPAIGTADGLLVLLEVQPAGKTRLSGDVFLRGEKNWDAA